MSKVRVRLLGGFEVWNADREVGGFESQKVRALLAYLACQRTRPFSRDHLSGLLWPEKSVDAARHALRQALYNLKSRLPMGESGEPLLSASHLDVRFDPRSECWLDVDAFEESLRQGSARDSIDPQRLAAAARLYRGELLTGFFVRGCPDFEDWLMAEQERLREAAAVALRSLIDSYRRRGEYRFAVHYARRLVAIDPLSEEAHRELIQLCASTGQRGRALAQFEEMEKLLKSELGVEPGQETRALYRSILTDSRPAVVPSEDAEPMGPLIPLVGRAAALDVLRTSWRRAKAGRAQAILVEGESGVGKSRLVKSFLDTATGKTRATVLKGHCYELGPRVPYQPWSEVLRNALADEDKGERALASSGREVLAELVRLVPELAELRHDLPEPEPLLEGEGSERDAGRERLFDAVADFLAGLCDGGRRGGDPLVIFLDDLQAADRASLDLLAHVATRLAASPVWLVLVRRVVGEGEEAPAELGLECLTHLALGRLGAAEVEEIAASLVGEGEAAELARFLAARAEGLPLAMAELVNFLWDEGALAARDGVGWSLVRPLAELPLPPVGDLDDLVLVRVRRLPNSTRRLVALAAVAGQSFEAALLERAAGEHAMVVEVGLELLLKRWLVRRFVPAWTSRRREQDIVLWARGARGGSFEFAHKRIRSAVYRDLSPARRQVIHAEVATALEQLAGGARANGPEALAYHHVAAGQWREALASLERAAERARDLRAERAALHYYDLALAAAARLQGERLQEEDPELAARAEAWQSERERIAARRRAREAKAGA